MNGETAAFEIKVGDTVTVTEPDDEFFEYSGKVVAIEGETVFVALWTLSGSLKYFARELGPFQPLSDTEVEALNRR